MAVERVVKKAALTVERMVGEKAGRKGASRADKKVDKMAAR